MTTEAKAAAATTAADPVAAEDLRRAVRSGSAREARGLLEPHPVAELRHLVKELPKLRSEVRALEGTDRRAASRQRTALITAAILCVQTPAQAATWLTAGLMAQWQAAGAAADPVRLLTTRRDRDWIGDLARRLVEKMRRETDDDYWTFVTHLAHYSDTDLPMNPGYLRGWLTQAAGWGRRRDHPAGLRPTLLAWLRAQPRLQQHIEAICEFDDFGGNLLWGSFGRDDDPDELWSTAIAKLAEEGVLDRSALIDASAARLLRGDRSGSLRGHLKVFEALAPTPVEVRQRYGTYASMAASGPSIVAKLALRELRALDTAEPFEPVDLAELSESVLGRPESGLVNGQLGWIDAALKRDPGTMAILLPCLAAAFTHPASATQQRALKVLAKYASRADARTLDGLRDAAQSLDAALRAEADRILRAATPADAAEVAAAADGSAAADASDAAAGSDAPLALGLPEYHPSPLPPLPSTPEELLTALAPSFTGGQIAPLEAEQIMAAVAILAHKDRAGLAAGFRPFAERHPLEQHNVSVSVVRWSSAMLTCLLYAVVNVDSRRGRVRLDRSDGSPNHVTALRVQELADHLLYRGSVPLLLATPTEASGAIDPAILAERLEAYRLQGVEPLPYDLEQANARTAGRPELRDELDALADAEVGLQAGAELPRPRRRAFDVLAIIGSLPRPRPSLASDVAAADLLYPSLVRDGKPRFPAHDAGWGTDDQSSYWPVLLPHDPDVVAAHAMGGLYNLANGDRGDEVTIFPSLAETAGVPGPATHLALAYGLAADRLEHRIAAQDALLTLAARGLLVTGQLGRYAVELWLGDMIRGKRLVEALVRCEQAGAAADVLGVVAAVIARLATRPDTRGLPDLLLLATRCVVAAGVRGVEIPGLPVLAALPKPKRVAVEARRLVEALGACP